MTVRDYPAYRSKEIVGALKKRSERLLETLESCVLCPRRCGVNRLKDERGVCETGRYAKVSSAFPHFGEESCLVGLSGSGTIFFANCNLRCVFCQNYDISSEGAGREVSPEQLAALMIELQRIGCHNINFVTPSHAAAQIMEALPLAVERGLNLPIVYNTSAYDEVNTLKIFDGVADIYMPDFKFWEPRVAKKYANAEDYPDKARLALKEMHRQVGNLEIDNRGLAARGLLVRHLAMPNRTDCTSQILKFLAEEISRETFVNIMEQYRPSGQVRGGNFSEIARRITPKELEDAFSSARKHGLHRFDL